jgi:hypothetical protein
VCACGASQRISYAFGVNRGAEAKITVVQAREKELTYAEHAQEHTGEERECYDGFEKRETRALNGAHGRTISRRSAATSSFQREVCCGNAPCDPRFC